ncbi:MAG: 9-O-acetylesterase [Bacteroidales bacterium]|nr:9-O-acetylesterase [Bacteroidales bacterium]
MKKILVSGLLVLAALSAGAKVQLTPLFTDNMVLQQNCQAPVWGKAAPGATVIVIPSWNGKTYRTEADADGCWQVRIPTPKGGFRKYTLTVSDGEPVVLKNVVAGEVWLASGQSNMERTFGHERFIDFFTDRINSASDWADVRMLTVSRSTGMVPHESFEAEGGGWEESSPGTIPHFSAVGWFFGQRLLQELKVPVGIIHTSWGGTIIEAWMSEDALKGYPEMQEPLAMVRALPDSEAEREESFQTQIDAFMKRATASDLGTIGGVPVWAQPSYNDGAWRTIDLPLVVQQLWPATNGIFWFRKEIDIPAEWAGQDLTLSLGTVDDFDETYWNGDLVGFSRLWSKLRVYTIPGRMVKGGKAVISVRNVDDHGNGGLYGDASLLFVEGPDGRRIRLDNEWKVALSVSFEGIPRSAAREPNLATVLYNGMLRPLAPYAIKGAIWYQGESNADKAYRYRDLMADMVLDWRRLWGYDFPFYITQLAGFKPVTRVAGDNDWAELREAQTLATQVVDQVGMACIIDMGEAEDIHPVHKQEVGERLARLALARDYGRKVVCDGPKFASYKIGDGCVRVRFSDEAGGLCVLPSGDYAELRYGKAGMDFDMVQKAESGILCGFQIAGPDRVWHWAQAVIDGDEVIVSCPDVPHPLAVRYAWGANPICNLFNSEGLPAWPFRTDDWPGVTYGKL